MRHSAAHMMAAAVLELFPDAKLGIGPAIKDGFYYDFDLPRPLTPADLEQIEAKMREQQAADLAFEHSKDLPRADAVAELEREGPAVQGRDRQRPARVRRADRQLLPARLVRGPVPRRAPRLDEGARRLQAPQHRRRLLARRRDAADAPAHLRHRVGHPGRSSTSICGGSRRPRSATIASSAASSTCSPSIPSRRRRPSSTRVAWRSGARSRTGRARSAARPASTRSARRAWCARSCGRRAATGATTRTTCSSSTTTTTSPG